MVKGNSEALSRALVMENRVRELGVLMLGLQNLVK
jgi:hypothetical protein